MSDYHTHPPLLKPSSAAVLPPIPTTHPFSDGNSTTSHQSETAASPSMNDNGATPPLRQQPPPPPRNASFPAREDCWSEDATSTLIEAWGDRFIELNRGNLRQKHWQDVADAVNHRHGHARKSRRSDIQCKNRIDTLKKKYKVEKSKVMELGANNYISPWPFFAPLDLLIGSLFKPSSQTPTPPPNRKRKIPSSPALLPPSSSVPVGRRSKRPAPPPYQPSTDSSYFRRNFSVMAAAAAAIDGAEDDYDSDTSWSGGANGNWSRCRSWSRSRSRSQSQNQFQNRQANEIGNEKVKPRFVVENDDGTSGDSYHQLAEAIGKFAEVYARVEEAKQKQIIELEKLRMQFTKDLELQRLKLLMESQMQLVKLKHFNRIDEEDHSTSIN